MEPLRNGGIVKLLSGRVVEGKELIKVRRQVVCFVPTLVLNKLHKFRPIFTFVKDKEIIKRLHSYSPLWLVVAGVVALTLTSYPVLGSRQVKGSSRANAELINKVMLPVETITINAITYDSSNITKDRKFILDRRSISKERVSNNLI